MKVRLLIALLIPLTFTCCKNKSEDITTTTENHREVEIIENKALAKNIKTGTDTLWRNEFKLFFSKFAIDSTFQKEHVLFPLKEVYTDFSNENTRNIVTKYKDKDKYKYLNLTIDTTDLNKEFEYEYQKTTIKSEKIGDTIIYTENSGAIMIKYKFAPYNNSWNLIEVKDLSI